MMEYLTDVGLHYLIGLAGAGAGWWARGFCRHISHRLLLTGGVVAVEAVVSVALVG